jgi:hypothetical protein
MKILSRTVRKARGKHCARLRYIDDDGKKHELLRTAENKSEAKTKLAQLETELMEKGPARLEAGKITFRQLAEYAIKRFYQAATYDETGRKVSGVRSVVPARSAINNLLAYFGDTDIRKIDDEALEKFKTHRLKTVSIATVDRELSKARKMFGVALSKKWIFDNPFKTEAGKQLIQVAAEKGACGAGIVRCRRAAAVQGPSESRASSHNSGVHCCAGDWRSMVQSGGVLKVETYQLQS